MQISTLQRLDELIEESRELEAQAMQLQSEGPLNLSALFAVQQFREQAESWYASALDVLPPDPKERFKQEWTGPKGDCGQEHFVAEPTVTGPTQQKVFNDEYLQSIPPGRLRFTFPFERCFQKPLHRQRRILIEAKHHADIMQQARGNDADVVGLEFDSLHHAVVKAACGLFADGHYRNAIFQACTALTEAVQEKSEITDRDGTSLMEHVFSANKTVLTVSKDTDEQVGMMWLFKGAVMGIRNPRGHHVGEGEDLDVTEAFEWLAFISALMKVVERSERINRGGDGEVLPNSQHSS